MNNIITPKLKSGDTIRIIAPSNSGKILSAEQKEIAEKRFKDIGISITYGESTFEDLAFDSASTASKIKDLHEAFEDEKINGIIAVRGGFNSNELLDYIDWNIIKNNPKIFCGFSDITVLHNAIFAMTGLVTYHSPNFSNFGQLRNFDYTFEYFTKSLIGESSYIIPPSKEWNDDKWWENQNDIKLMHNEGYVLLNSCEERNYTGKILGGNISSFALLQGTQYFPDLEGSVLLIEDDEWVDIHIFNRYLESILQQKNSDKIHAIIIGRFQRKSEVSLEDLRKIIRSKEKLKNIPVVFGIDIGHTTPQATMPIGGILNLKIMMNKIELEVVKH